MLQDLKNACRELLKNRWFTCIMVLTLALGIGANTAIFGVVNRLLLNPLPYPDADRLVHSDRRLGCRVRLSDCRISRRQVARRSTVARRHRGI